MTGLVWAQATKLHHVFAGNSAVTLDVLQHHLLLLDAIEPSLADVAGALAQITVGFSAKEIDTPDLAPLRAKSLLLRGFARNYTQVQFASPELYFWGFKYNLTVFTHR